jgi:hypothetical protein
MRQYILARWPYIILKRCFRPRNRPFKRENEAAFEALYFSIKVLRRSDPGSGLIRRKGLTQVEAAKLLGLTQPKVSAMLRGQFRGFSERKLIDCLTRLGRDVQIVIKDAPERRMGGKLTVVVA